MGVASTYNTRREFDMLFSHPDSVDLYSRSSTIIRAREERHSSLAALEAVEFLGNFSHDSTWIFWTKQNLERS